jgi:6-pyruvoyltetrahydropterin/6-carboxytetrahydropterin synthase
VTTARVCKRFKFSAAHYVPGYDGPCANVHGHTFHAEVFAQGETDELGMVLDFSELKRLWMKFCDPLLDHATLNDVVEMPSTENVAAWILSELSHFEPRIYMVRLWEGPEQYAEVSRAD